MEKETWKDRVLNSLEGMEKAVPREGLLKDIVQQIKVGSNAIVPMRQWRFATAAAVLLLIVNFWMVQQFVKGSSANSKKIVIRDLNKPALISNYKLYE